jgi:hypothetical protein
LFLIFKNRFFLHVYNWATLRQLRRIVKLSFSFIVANTREPNVSFSLGG